MENRDALEVLIGRLTPQALQALRIIDKFKGTEVERYVKFRKVMMKFVTPPAFLVDDQDTLTPIVYKPSSIINEEIQKIRDEVKGIYSRRTDDIIEYEQAINLFKDVIDI